MGLRAWIGFIAVSVFIPVYYMAMYPAWDTISIMVLDMGVSPDLIRLLDSGLYWVPLMIVLAALAHALLSPATLRSGGQWRNDQWRR